MNTERDRATFRDDTGADLDLDERGDPDERAENERGDTPDERDTPERGERARRDERGRTRRDAAPGEGADQTLAMLDAISKRLDSMEKATTARLDAMERRRPSKGTRDDETFDPASPPGATAETAADSAKRRADAAKKEREDESSLGDAQARCDGVAAGWGERAPAPMSGERLQNYRTRLVRRFQKYSPAFADVNLTAIADASAFSAIETKIYADAAAAARDPSQYIADGVLQQRTRTNEEGHRITEFFGRETFIKGLKRPSMRVTSIITPERRAM